MKYKYVVAAGAAESEIVFYAGWSRNAALQSLRFAKRNNPGLSINMRLVEVTMVEQYKTVRVAKDEFDYSMPYRSSKYKVAEFLKK